MTATLTKEQLDACVARLDRLVHHALGSREDADAVQDREAWRTLKGHVRRPRRQSEELVAPLAQASLHIAQARQHATNALEALGDIATVHRERGGDEVLIEIPPPTRLK